MQIHAINIDEVSVLCIFTVFSHNENYIQVAWYFPDCDDFLYFFGIVVGSRFQEKYSYSILTCLFSSSKFL